ncbi:hypothetical protein ACQPZJ_44795 [Actinoplanes sp. CA-054009]
MSTITGPDDDAPTSDLHQETPLDDRGIVIEQRPMVSGGAAVAALPTANPIGVHCTSHKAVAGA